jgi:uncharacterized ion transporter superfamily protein YfcC
MATTEGKANAQSGAIEKSEKKLNVDDLAREQNVTVENTSTTTEPIEEMRTRLRIKEQDAKYKRIKELFAWIAGLIMILTMFGLCIWIIVRDGWTIDEKRLAFGLVFAIITGFLGFITGRVSKGKE